LTDSTETSPPTVGASMDLRQDLTVPTRVLETVASTVPFETVVNMTGTGFGLVEYQMLKIAAPATAATRRERRRIVLFMNE
jgi:hypothetical protein